MQVTKSIARVVRYFARFRITPPSAFRPFLRLLPKFLNHNLLHHRAILNRIKLTITTLDFPNKVRPKIHSKPIRSKGIHRKPIHSRPIHSRDIRSKGIHQRLIQKQPVMKRKATVSRKD